MASTILAEAMCQCD